MLRGRTLLAEEHEESDSEGDEGDDEVFVRRETTTVEDDLPDASEEVSKRR